MKRIRFNLDTLGACASTLCLFHCLALPLLAAALPLLSMSAIRASAAAILEQPTMGDSACCSERACDEGSQGAEDCRAVCCSTPADFWIHVGLFATVAPLGFVAWFTGYLRHQQPFVLALGLAGVLLLAGAIAFGHQLLGGYGEPVMTVSGSICMVSAHLWNRRQCACCGGPEQETAQGESCSTAEV